MEAKQSDTPWFIPAGEDEWKCVGTLQLVHQHRRGWWGVWDALKAVLLKNDRVVVPVDTELTVWVHSPSKIDNARTFVSPVGYVSSGYGASYAAYVNGVQTKLVKEEPHYEG